MKAMKKLMSICAVLLAFALGGCNRQSSDVTPTDSETTTRVLTTNPWKLDKITDLNGNVINPNLLPPEGKSFFGVNILFSEDKTVRAIDPIARTVVNGGSWDFLDDAKALNIDLGKDFKGKYPINKLERSTMSLRNTMEFNGIKFEVNLELVPAL